MKKFLFIGRDKINKFCSSKMLFDVLKDFFLW